MLLLMGRANFVWQRETTRWRDHWLLKALRQARMCASIGVGEQYDVHRCKFHIPLIYGRHGDPSLEEGKGILICKIMQGNRTLFCLITYVYPTLSARAVPQSKEFCKTH
ncbi:hypothetical protein Plhal304r1_c059g0147781 [Plasmopara halstedii]